MEGTTATAEISTQPPADYPITVLLIDDQPIVGEAVRRMLADDNNISFHFCADPLKAIETAVAVSPTVILQDLVMPQVDGLMLVKFFRANPRTAQIPLIVLSSKEEPVTKAEAFANGANDYLVKLPDKLEMLARIKYHSRAYINLLQRNEAYSALEASRKVLADELSRAGEYVISLLPAPLDGEIKTAWEYVPSMQLGGDAFGYHWQDEDHFAMYLLDVCGHGVGAALLSVTVMNTLQTRGLAGVDFTRPGEVLTGLNEAFQMERHNNMFFTIWYGVYNKKTRELVCASGGHPPAVLIDAQGKLTQIEKASLMIGSWPGIKYDCQTFSVAPGTKLFVYSDGIFEIYKPDGNLWTFEEFIQVLAARNAPGKTDADRILSRVTEVRGGNIFEDDITLLEVVF